MTDALGEALAAVAARSPLAYPLVFAAGAVTSIGPCAAPRYVAVAACAHAARRPWAVLTAFAAGIVGAYVAVGAAAGAVSALWAASAALYAVMATGLAAGGMATLARAGGERHAHEPVHDGVSRRGASLGGMFLLGASTALVVSPCCTPVVAAIAGLTLTSGHGAAGTALLAAFGCGHVVPVIAAGAFGSRLSNALRRVCEGSIPTLRSGAAAQVPAIVAGSLMLALAAYYGVLA